MGADKMLAPLRGVPVLVRTLMIFERHPAVRLIVVAASTQGREAVEEIAGSFSKVSKVVVGGAERQDSVRIALDALPADDGDILVAIHDGARPLLEPSLLDALLDGLPPSRCAILAVPVNETLKRVEGGGIISRTVPRDELWLAQTPQVFPLDVIRHAHRVGKERGTAATDDAALVEAVGVSVKVVCGSYENIKITTPADIVLAEAILGIRHRELGIRDQG
jgi:2-C-methyl-D-erythritol 4-phosphate cytidylyltransferase